MKKLLILAALSMAAWSAQAKEPNDLDQIKREIKIAEDVIEAALRAKLEDVFRVSDVEANYLANQGVLVNVTLTNRSVTHDIEITGLDQIPTVVQNILNKVQIEIEPYEPEELAELRELREEQRQIRNQQRNVRRDLRSMRSQLSRANSDDTDEIEDEIARLADELANLEHDYAILETDIDHQYERVREARRMPEVEPASPEFTDVADAISRVACDYGATLRSLRNDENLSFIVNERRFDTVLVYRQRDIIDCQRETIQASQLRERAFVYQH